MKVTQNLGEIKEIFPIMEESFADNRNHWEITDSEDEYACIADGQYKLGNRSEQIWTFYGRPAQTNRHEEYIIDAEITFLSANKYSNYGIVWGYEREPETLNRFTLNAFSGRATITSFFRHGSETIKRFSKRCQNANAGKESTNRFIIMKLQNRLFFFINDLVNPVFESDINFFTWSGSYAGFYLEPGMVVSGKRFSVKKIISEQVENECFREVLSV